MTLAPATTHTASLRRPAAPLLQGQAAVDPPSNAATMRRLTASVLHEIGTPLQAIRSCVELHLDTLPPDSPSRDYLLIAVEEIERLRQVLGVFRELLEAEPQPRQEIDLNGVLEEVARLLDSFLAHHDVRLDLQLGPGLPSVQARRRDLRELLLNLIVYAQQRVTLTGPLHLRTAAVGSELVLEMEDSRRGRPSAHGVAELAELDDPALELEVARSLAVRCGGDIEVQHRPGHGSLYRLVLPAAGAGETPSRPRWRQQGRP